MKESFLDYCRKWRKWQTMETPLQQMVKLQESEEDKEFKHCVLCNFTGTKEEIKNHMIDNHKLTKL